MYIYVCIACLRPIVFAANGVSDENSPAQVCMYEYMCIYMCIYMYVSRCMCICICISRVFGQ